MRKGKKTKLKAAEWAVGSVKEFLGLSGSDAVEILHRRYYQGRPDRLAALEEARANDGVARKLTSLRLQAGLTQRQLAKLVGTTASVICRLEDADYEGHSLVMLNRIAAVLKQRIEIRFVPAAQRKTLKTA
jgi:DNA-binding XRE family transcriptional regulator